MKVPERLEEANRSSGLRATCIVATCKLQPPAPAGPAGPARPVLYGKFSLADSPLRDHGESASENCAAAALSRKYLMPPRNKAAFEIGSRSGAGAGAGPRAYAGGHEGRQKLNRQSIAATM